MFGLGGGRNRRFWDLAAAALAAVLVAACAPQAPGGSGGSSSAPGAGGAGSAAPGTGTAWERVLARIEPNGEVDRQLALDAFALAFGPLPGITRPEGPDGQIQSGTWALRMLRRYWGTLTPEQQAEADRLIKGRASSASNDTSDQRVFAAGFNPAPPARRVAPAITQAEYQAMADKWVDVIAGKLGRVITGDVQVIVNEVQPLDEGTWDADAYVDGWDAELEPQGDMIVCAIHINPSGQTNSGIDAEGLMAHEVFHCFQDDQTTIAASRNQPAWIGEGTAAWAEQVLTGGDLYGPNRWAAWLIGQNGPLFARTYDAQGIYFLLGQTGVDPWTVMDEFHAAAAANEAAFGVLRKAGGQAFVDTWGSRFHMAPDLSAWIYEGPGMGPTEVPPRVQFPGTTGTQTSRVVQPWRAMPGDVTVDADVVVIAAGEAAGGLVHLPKIGEAQLAEIDRPLCTLPGGCVCEEDSPNAGQQFIAAEKGKGRLAVTATGAPVTIVVSGMTLEAFCETALVDPCLVGTWVSASLESSVALISGGDGMILTIHEDGTFLVDYDLMERISGMPWVQTDPPFWVEMWWNGTMTGKLSAWEGEYHVLERDGSDATMSFSVFVNGEEEKVMENESTVDIAADLGGLPNAPTGLYPADAGTYECNSTQAVLFYDSGKTTTNRQ